VLRPVPGLQADRGPRLLPQGRHPRRQGGLHRDAGRSAGLGADYSWPADYRQAPTELEAIVEDFAAAGAAGKLADLLVKADNKSNVQLTIAWGTVSLIGTSAVELNRKGWKWPELPDNSFTGTAEQVASAVTADGFTCTSSNGGGVQNCDRGPDLVTAISGPDGIHTIAIRAGSWTAARTLQEHIFQALPGDAEQTGDRKPLASRWFAAGEASGARAYVDGLLLCQTRYSSSTVFGISALVPAGTTSSKC
jgi:hypothetical protein